MTQPTRRRWSRLPPEVWVPLVFAAISTAWVVGTDWMVARWYGSGPGVGPLETAKGVFYLFLTAGLIHLLLRTVLGRMRAALRRAEQSEARAVQLLEGFQEGLFVMQDGRIVYANPAAGRLFGVPREQLIGLGPADLADPSDAAKMDERARAVEEGRPFAGVALRRSFRRDGRPFIAESEVAAIEHEGRPAVQVVARDVTEREYVARALRFHVACGEVLLRAGTEQELLDQVCRAAVADGMRFATAVVLPAGSPAAYRVAAHCGVDGPYLEVSARVAADAIQSGGGFLGLERGEPVSVPDLERAEPGDVGREAVRLGARSAVLVPVMSSSGLVAVLTLGAAETDAFRPAVVDTLRPLAADLAVALGALRTRAMLEALLEHAPAAIYVTRPDGELLLANRWWERFSGITRHEAAQRRLEDFAPPEQVRSVRETNREVLARRGPIRLARSQRVGDELRDFEIVKFPLFDGAGDVSAVAAIALDVTAARRSEAALRESRESLRALAARLQSVREEETARIARDLHDELGQLLTGLSFELRGLEQALGDRTDDPSCGPLLDRAVAASALADETQAAVQRIAAELRPGALDRLGLATALRQRARLFQERHGVGCDVALPEEEVGVHEPAATALYRIAQEALTNVARHAGATAVELRLAVEHGEAVLAVRDDGRGFDPEAQGPKGLGLLGMRERAAMLGGTVEIDSGPGAGTTVRARIPLARPAGPPPVAGPG